MQDGIPTTWAELESRAKDVADSQKETLDFFLNRIVKGNFLGRASKYNSMTKSLLFNCLFYGKESVISYFDALNSLAGELKEELPRLKDNHVLPYLGLMRFGYACNYIGYPADPFFDSIIEPSFEKHLKYKREVPETERYNLAFFALEADKPELVEKFSGGKIKKRVEPGEQFGPNLQGWMCYLAAARGRGFKYEDILPAWEDFLKYFPLKYGANTLDYMELFSAASNVMSFDEDKFRGIKVMSFLQKEVIRLC